MGKLSSCSTILILLPGILLILLFILLIFTDSEQLDFKPISKGSKELRLVVPADEGNDPFDQAAWLSGKYPAKTEEIKKLIKQRLLEDKSMEELKQLLRGNTNRCATGDDWISCAFTDSGLSLYGLTIEVREIKPNKVYFEFVS